MMAPVEPFDPTGAIAMPPTTPDAADRLRRAQERALRAARAVTLTVSVSAALAGCATTVQGAAPDAPPVAVDAPAVAVDAPTVAVDVSAVADAGAANDDGLSADDAGAACSRDTDGGESWVECCTRIHWDWRRGCEAWGPFMPPSMEG